MAALRRLPPGLDARRAQPRPEDVGPQPEYLRDGGEEPRHGGLSRAAQMRPWQCLNFLPEPQGQAVLRPVPAHGARGADSRSPGRSPPGRSLRPRALPPAPLGPRSWPLPRRCARLRPPAPAPLGPRAAGRVSASAISNSGSTDAAAPPLSVGPNEISIAGGGGGGGSKRSSTWLSTEVTWSRSPTSMPSNSSNASRLYSLSGSRWA